MGDIADVFELSDGKYACEDCGETKRLQFGICCVCGGDVVENAPEGYLGIRQYSQQQTKG